MNEYRTGNHWGVTIVREGTGPTDSSGRRTGDELVAVITNGDRALAEQICALLNEVPCCMVPTCPDYGDPDFGEGTCPSWHADKPKPTTRSPLWELM